MLVLISVLGFKNGYILTACTLKILENFKAQTNNQISKYDGGERHTLQRLLSDIVNRADKNKDNDISLPEFLEIMKDIVRKTDTDCCIWSLQYLPLSGHFYSQNNLLLITGEEPQDRR